MDDTPHLDELQRIKTEYIGAFINWLPCLDDVFATGRKAGKTHRATLCAYLERSWQKLKRDLWGSLALIANNHIGPASILSRVCRENAMRMLVLSFSDPAADDANVGLFADVKSRQDTERLKRDVGAFLNKSAMLGLNPRVVATLQACMESADEMLSARECCPSTAESDLERKGFAKLTEIAVQRLRAFGLNFNILATQVRDYWIECEAVHSGINALSLYEPEDFGLDLHRNGELTALARIKDLYPIKPIVTAAVLNAVELLRALPKPRQAQDLAAVARRAEEMVVAMSQRAQSHHV